MSANRASGMGFLWFALMAAAANGQSTQPAAFVANNGNLEGSVSAFRVNVDGTLTFLNKQVIGTRVSGSDPCSGCNAYEISASPNGRWLATCHPAGVVDGLSVLEVAPGGTVSLRLNLNIGDAGNLDVVWLDNEYMATIFSLAGTDEVRTYRWNCQANTLTPAHAYAAGGSTAYLAIDPSRSHLYANDSTNDVVIAYSIGAGGTLTPIDSDGTAPAFPLEITVSPNGEWLYGVCGISSSGNKILGFDVAGDGTLSALAGSPFVSPNTSTGRCAVSDNNQFLCISHSNGVVRTFAIDGLTGTPTDTTFFFDVGTTGEVGAIACGGGFLFITDNFSGPTGLYSFKIGTDGSLAMNGTLQSTTGIAPRGIATWVPIPILGDLNCDFVLDELDVPFFVSALLDPAFVPPGGCSAQNADMNQDSLNNGDDAQPFIAALLGPC